MIVAKKGANLAVDDLWLCIELNKNKSGYEYFNLFPLSIISTYSGKRWTVVDHQGYPHGTNHRYPDQFEVVADLTSKDWVKTTIWNGSVISHPSILDNEKLLIKINDDDVDVGKDEELLKQALRLETRVYLDNLDKLDPVLQKRILDIKGIESLEP